MPTFKMTHHASRRSQQRGLRAFQIEALLDLADLCVPVGRNLNALRLSRDALNDAIADGLSPAIAANLERRAIVLADDGAIVTVAHLHGAKSRAYRRRDRRPYWTGAK